MKKVLLAILAVLISSSAFASEKVRFDDRRERREDRRDDRRERRDDRRERREDRRDRRDDRRERRNDRWGHGHHGGHGGHHGGGHGGGYYPGYPSYPGPGPIPYPGVRSVLCESHDGRPAICATGLRQIQQLLYVRQHSRARCAPNASFQIRGNAILVYAGCRATFTVRGF